MSMLFFWVVTSCERVGRRNIFLSRVSYLGLVNHLKPTLVFIILKISPYLKENTLDHYKHQLVDAIQGDTGLLNRKLYKTREYKVQSD
jgi:hypothetical protein